MRQCRQSIRAYRNGSPRWRPWTDGLTNTLQEENIHIVACGTVTHIAGMVGKTIERIARVPVYVDIAANSATGTVRQKRSGGHHQPERRDSDTLAAPEACQERGAKTLAVVNGWFFHRPRADCLPVHLRRAEIAVASTKAYSVQMAVLNSFALRYWRWSAAHRMKCTCATWTVELQRSRVAAPHSEGL